MKVYLKRIIRKQVLTLEEVLTLVYQIETCLNSMSLVPMSSYPEELKSSHIWKFLIVTALHAIPELNLISDRITLTER
ncbi:hypothetical protein CEXT_94832 [Caerostris extrusa]|uniref:Uncharacterized protein n=1 Tax=Caerostris extrusa TaxID=172846 RepID=A0AAV4QU33_CAEEX|nr:hypothetical protein CEXT_94832 [Caerostris extrusa]